MGFLIDQLAEVAGTVKSFLRASLSTPLPGSFVILDGSTLVDPDSGFNGQTLPDTRGKFIRGHPTLTNANFGADVTYFTGGGGSIPTGGVATHNLAHAHPGGSHTHSIAGHNHVINAAPTHQHAAASHDHTLGNHTHTIASDGAHDHTGITSAQTNRQVVSTPDDSEAGLTTRTVHQHSIPSASSHNHSAATGASSGNTGLSGAGSTGSGGSHDHGGVTNAGTGNTGIASGNTDSGLTTINNEPPWVGFIWMLKVK